jgi:Myo-inositol oxygenase
MPETNSFSPHCCRIAFGQPANIATIKGKGEFRNYVDSNLQERVATTYLNQHTNQTYEYAVAKRKQYSQFKGLELSVWEAAELLNNIVDESDPDADTPQINHLLQTAEVISSVPLSFFPFANVHRPYEKHTLERSGIGFI